MVVQIFPVMMTVADPIEPFIAGHAAISFMKEYTAQYPIFDAASS